MCDYSLELYRSKPARIGEKYVLTRFRSGAVGFASPGDCSTAVCIPYDAELRLEGIPEALQRELGVGPDEEVTFTRVDYGRFQDGFRFANGAETSLQRLNPGITAAVTRSLDHTVWGSRPAPVMEIL
jgi:hypothetical protein